MAAGHTVVLQEEVFEKLIDFCMSVFDGKEDYTVDALATKMMEFPEIPMHYPYHHFILPAAMLTLACRESGQTREDTLSMLKLAETRSKSVLGGFCGNFGACGSGVGAGIFISIYTGASPLAEESWQWANEITGISLQNLSTVPGPRCCKRTGYLSLEVAVPYANEKLGLNLKLSEKIECKFSEKNAECKKELCPYFVK